MNEDYYKAATALAMLFSVMTLCWYVFTIFLLENIWIAIKNIKLEDKKQESQSRTVAGDGYNRCPSCGRIDNGASKCSNCGHHLRWS